MQLRERDKPICVAIVDDHDAIRFAFKAACGEFGFEFCDSAGSVNELLERNPNIRCDVVVMDLSLADGSIVAENVTKLLKTGAQVVIFSIADKQNLVRAALRLVRQLWYQSHSPCKIWLLRFGWLPMVSM